MSVNESGLSFAPGAFAGCFYRGVVEEWSNYDSVAEEMVSTNYSYVEALRFAADGSVVAMAKIGAYSLDPDSNGARVLDAANSDSFNFLGEWSIVDGVLSATLRPASDKVSLSPKWVGIFYLPGTIALSGGVLNRNTLSVRVAYDRHPIWDDQPRPTRYEWLADSPKG